MNRKLTVIAVAAIALMLAGIAWAVTRLYSGEKPRQVAGKTEYPLLRAVPADAAAVFCFDGSSRARGILADSTGVLRSFLCPSDAAFQAYLNKAGEHRMLISLHNSGSLVPLVVTELKQFDSTAVAPYTALAENAGLKTTVQDGLLLASRSETLLNASCRHLDEGICILEAPGLQELSARMGGAAVAFLSSRQVPKILQVWSTARVRKQTDFIRTLADWTALEIAEADDKHIVLQGSAESPEKTTGFLSSFAGFSAPAATFAEALPYFADYAFSIPVGDIDKYLGHYRRFKDAKGKLTSYDKALKAREGREMSPEQWAQHYQVKEAVRAAYQLDGVRQEVLLVKTGRDIPSGTNVCPGGLSTLLGEVFRVTDTLCVSLPGHWTVLGSGPSAEPFLDRKFLEYPLKERLSDAGLSIPAGIVAYASVTDAPSILTDLLAKEPAAALGAYVTGSAYAPVLAGIDLGSGKPAIHVSLDKRALKGNKVQVLERDTTVFVPAGPFPVQNSATGKTNSFYQNKQLSLCLNDENGKGVWGVPFKQPL